MPQGLEPALVKERLERILASPAFRNSKRNCGLLRHVVERTLAAGEFVTHPEFLQKLEGRVPAGWEGRNVQAVIATDVVHGSSGPPKLLAVDVR